MAQKINLDDFSIILVRPKFPENLGAVARAMKNMGFRHLVVVDGCSPLHMNAYRMASGAEEVLERAEEMPTLDEAISDIGYLVGMTARTGRDRSPLLSPDALAKQLVSLSVGNRIGLVFGPEREGLRNEELSFCHLFVRIPCSGNFPSLNLAQAVMVICYELSKASDHAPERPRHLAESHQLEEMFEHMERTLIDIGFLDPDHPERIMRALRKVFGRSALDEREVRILRGVWSQMDWHLGRKRKTDGGG